MKKLVMLLTLAALCSVEAAPNSRKDRAAKGARSVASPQAGLVRVDQFPKLGSRGTMQSPSLEGQSTIGNNVYQKSARRKWIVLEAKYSTFDVWTDQLSFTWHVLLDSKFRTEKDAVEDIPQYSYYTVTVNYQNIPKGTHAASVCLPPACLERFGEPKAVGIVISDKDGKQVYGDVESEIKGIAHHPDAPEKFFWNDRNIMEHDDDQGRRLIEQRQGLQDRSKTIWALVNPNDYEQVM